MLWFKNKKQNENKDVLVNLNEITTKPIKDDNSNIKDTIKSVNKILMKKVTGLMDLEGDFINSISKIDESSRYTNDNLDTISSAIQEFHTNIQNFVASSLEKITCSIGNLSNSLSNISTKLDNGVSKTTESLKLFSDIKTSNSDTDEKIKQMNLSFKESAAALDDITNSVMMISNKSHANMDLVSTLQKKESMKIDYFSDTMSFLEQLEYLLNNKNISK